MEPVIIVKSRGHVIARCGPACYDGIQARCTCCCGGMNHAVGLNKAIKNTRNTYKAVIAARYPVYFEPIEVVYPRVEPRLFD